VHNIHTQELTLAEIEDRGIDAAEFWRYLYYKRPRATTRRPRDGNPVDLLASGIFAAHFINTVSPTFLDEIVDGRHSFIPPHPPRDGPQEGNAGCAVGILNAPDPSFDPAPTAWPTLHPDDHAEGKRANKREFQESWA
jgi:starch synthase